MDLPFDSLLDKIVHQPFTPGNTLLCVRNAAATFDIAVARAHSTCWPQVPGPKSQAPGPSPRPQVAGPRCQVTGPRFQNPGPMPQVSDPRGAKMKTLHLKFFAPYTLHHNTAVLHHVKQTLTMYGPLFNQFEHRKTAYSNINSLHCTAARHKSTRTID